MSSSYFLTLEQGVVLMIESVFFIVLYIVYLNVSGGDPTFMNIVFTSLLFILWLFSVTIITNLSFALNFPLSNNIY